MGNCLVTKLKSVVNNDNLSKLGVLKVVVNRADSIEDSRQQRIIIAVKANSSVTLTANGSGYLSPTVEGLSDPAVRQKSMIVTYNYGNDTTIYFSNETFTIDVSDKYNITQLYLNSIINKNIASFNIDELSASNSLQELAVNNSYGNIYALNNLNELRILLLASDRILGSTSLLSEFTSLTKLNLNGSGVVGTLSDLSKLTNISILEINQADVTGELESIGAFTSLTLCPLEGSSISGTVDGFVANQRTSGRTTESTGITMAHLLTKCTFNGNLYTSESNSTILTWDESKIAVYIGSSISAATKVYCKGYTQEEAEAAFSGKTIIRVDAE